MSCVRSFREWPSSMATRGMTSDARCITVGMTAAWAAPAGGVMIDLSGWKSAEVDPLAKTVRAQPGLTSGELNRATMEHGLAVPTGKISSVGIGGMTVGGGIGWLARKHGLAIDHLRSVE